MTQEHKYGIMTLRVDPNKVEFLCAGCTATVIERPYVVGVMEWEDFWGGHAARAPNSGAKFTHEEALTKHHNYRERTPT